jgi:hypothetical protein
MHTGLSYFSLFGLLDLILRSKPREQDRSLPDTAHLPNLHRFVSGLCSLVGIPPSLQVIYVADAMAHPPGIRVLLLSFLE